MKSVAEAIALFRKFSCTTIRFYAPSCKPIEITCNPSVSPFIHETREEYNFLTVSSMDCTN